MTAIGGARDTLLQATAERFSTIADGKAILLAGSTPVFRVNSAGAGAPGSIAITVKPVNVVGDIVFSVSSGTQIAVDGNVATVDFATMITDTALVQARIREFGVDYIANYMISKVFDGVAGESGLAGLNTGQAFAYKRAVGVPGDSPGDVIFTFASAAITTPAGNDLANGWSKNIPAGSAPLYVRVAAASSRNATDSIAANEWAGAVQLARDGADGMNTAQAFAYKRVEAAPGDVIYTFAMATITTPAGNDLANGWSKGIPAGTAPLYVRIAAASSRNATDAIAANEWTAAVLLAKDGTPGQNGVNVAPVRIYQRAAANVVPTLPSATCTFTFATGALTGLNNGWSSQVPTVGGAYLFTSGATAASISATDDIAASEWAVASRMAADGENGVDGLNVSLVRIYQRGTTNIAPALPSAACTFTFATGALTGLNNGWLSQVPTAGGAYLFTSGATAASRTSTDDIAPGEWAAAARMAADGATGQRGTVTVTASGYSAWSDASAVYELGHAGYGAPINRDVVTLYDATHAVTKYFDNGAWLVLGTVLNGNLLVDGSVAAKSLSVDNLAAINANLGNVVAGDLYGTTLHGGAGYPTNAYAWPSNAGVGFHLSSAGLLLGNYSLGKYIEMRSDGYVDMPGLKIEGGRANFSGNVISGTGAGFRVEMGPDDPVYAMWAGSGVKNDINAIFHIKRDGSAYFGGALTAGALRTAVTSPEINPNAQLINGPFGSNGGLITVICSFDWQRSMGSTRATYTAGAGTTRAVVSLYRGLAGAPADTLLASSTFTGPPAAIENTSILDEMSTCKLSVSGSFTFTDDARSTANHTYRVTVAMVEQAVTIGSRPGDTRPPLNAVYQRLSNTTVE